MTLIGITGQKQHGKDSLWRMVLAPRGYQRLALADPLKGLLLATRLAPLLATQPLEHAERPALSRTLASLREHYYAYYGAHKTPTVRQELQQIGTDLIRANVDPGFWIALALAEAQRIITAGGRVAVTDVRFPNEAHAILGDRAALARDYGDYQRAGGVVDRALRDQLLTPWGETSPDGLPGLLPPRGLGCIIRVVRSGSRAPADSHLSETSIAAVTASHILTANNPLELRALGEALLAALGVP